MRFLSFALSLAFSLTSAYGQPNPARLKIDHLTGDFYVYTTYNTYEGDQIPAHGMYLVAEDGVALFDTPWDTTQFQPLLDSIQARHHKNVVLCLATHWHSDRTEGLAYYKQQGIKTYTTARTDELSKQNHKKRAEFLLAKDTTFTLGHYAFDTYYPGEGHTLDNIVVWFKQEKILYGGCLIKGAEAENLGYLGDGNEAAYATTLKRVREKCPHPQFILVSHHDWRNRKSLKHSIKLAKRLRARKHARWASPWLLAEVTRLAKSSLPEGRPRCGDCVNTVTRIRMGCKSR